MSRLCFRVMYHHILLDLIIEILVNIDLSVFFGLWFIVLSPLWLEFCWGNGFPAVNPLEFIFLFNNYIVSILVPYQIRTRWKHIYSFCPIQFNKVLILLYIVVYIIIWFINLIKHKQINEFLWVPVQHNKLEKIFVELLTWFLWSFRYFFLQKVTCKLCFFRMCTLIRHCGHYLGQLTIV